MENTLIEAAPIAIPDAALADLRTRLMLTRWPEKETVADWSQGARLAHVRNLCEYWRDRYDWRRCEAMLNGWTPQRTTIDGLGIHFFHVRSSEPDALPVVMTHGWPGSVIEFHKVVAALTEPRSHGGDPTDAVHLVLPSLPGHGFSDKPADTGWSLPRIADAWSELMRRLGYGARWGAQGGDWGAEVAATIGSRQPAGCIGIHLNGLDWAATDAETASADANERVLVERKKRFRAELAGFYEQQTTRPQTIGYALADSPVGQAAWIYEKYHDWTDPDVDPERIFTMDEMLDNIMLYWITNTGASSARRYWEYLRDATDKPPVLIPTAFSRYPNDIGGPSERWAHRRFKRIVRWAEAERGGHFAAFEQPASFIDEVRAGFRAVRHAT